METEALVKNVKEMLHSVELKPNRAGFFKDINEMKEEEFFKKWFPDSIKVKLERAARISMAKTGLYKTVKNVAKKILRK